MMAPSFLPFSDEGLRIAANLDQRHDAWVAAIRQLEALPSSMFFSTKNEREYLTVKKRPGDNGTTVGARNADTERTLETYRRAHDSAKSALADTERALAEIIRQYRALRLPLAMPLPARILRALDIANLLGTDLMLVGTNAFAAYEIEAGCRFLSGVDETDDFDLAWCREDVVELSSLSRADQGSPLMAVLKDVDPTFRINKAKPYQALNSAGYPVELLVAPSKFKTLVKGEVFSCVASFHKQEWLLQGRPMRHVVVSRDNRTCPIFAPDPRWMAMHKMWLSRKNERDVNKRPKDAKQAEVLLEALRDRMSITYPMDIDFVLSLPDELRDLFNEWASANGFTPSHPNSYSLR